MIRTVKCPECGSTKNTLLYKNYYHCDKCQFNFLVQDNSLHAPAPTSDQFNHDTNNAQIEFKQYDSSQINQNKRKRLLANRLVLLFICLFPIATGVPIFLNFIMDVSLSNKTTSATTAINQVTLTPVSSNSTPRVGFEHTSPSYSSSIALYYTYLSSNDTVYSFEITKRIFDKPNTRLTGYYYAIYDVRTGIQLKSARLMIDEPASNDRWVFRRFDDGITYLVYGDTLVYTFNEQKLTIKNVTELLFTQNPTFAAGITQIELMPWGYEDSLLVFTQDQQQFVYYPSINKYFYMHSSELATYFRQLDKNRQYTDQQFLRTVYFFDKNWQNERLTLFKATFYSYNIEQSYLINTARNSNGEKSYKITFKGQEGPMVSETILSPETVYYHPSVVYSSPTQLIIKNKNSVDANAYYNLHSLDPNTGEIIWTIKGDNNTDFSRLELGSKHKLGNKTLLFADGDNYIVQLKPQQYLLVTATGKVERIDYQHR